MHHKQFKKVFRFCVLLKRINAEHYPKAKSQLLTWYNEMVKQEFDNFNELKAVYGNASIINNQRVVFNIKGNDYRLIVSLNLKAKSLLCYLVWNT